MRTYMEFDNEIGNFITVSAETLQVAGVKGIRVVIDGPLSKTVNDMTLKEAGALRTVLSGLE